MPDVDTRMRLWTELLVNQPMVYTDSRRGMDISANGGDMQILLASWFATRYMTR
jgi:hypothetical protein